MCNVNSGVLIKNKQDVQNLVIGIIFRQQDKYKRENIIDIVQYYMEGSPFVINENVLQNIISENLNLLCRNDKIQCKNGYFIPRTFTML